MTPPSSSRARRSARLVNPRPNAFSSSPSNSARRRTPSRKKRLVAVIDSSSESEAAEALLEKISSEEGDFIIVRRETPKKRRREESEELEDAEEDELPVRRRVRAAKMVEESDSDGADSEEEENAHTPRANVKGKKTLSRREEEDLQEDMEMIRESSPLLPSSASKSKSSARKDALAQLRRDRARRSKSGRPSRVISDDEDDEAFTSSMVHREAAGDGDECITSSSDADPIANDALDEPSDDDGFVIEDEEIGVPMDIPIEFTRWQSAKPRELFRYAIDFLVQKRLNPAFAASDDIYRVAWQKLDDQVCGLTQSKFSSAAWSRDFHVALHARPVKRTGTMPAFDQHCQACNRSGHPATRRIQFTGAPYARDSLEDLEQDERDEEQGVVRDGRGRVVPDEEIVYSLGQTCWKNAVAAHTLEHWRRDLMQDVWTRLEAMEELVPRKIVERDGLSVKKRREYANGVVDRMEQEGIIRELYHIYKDTIEDATLASVSCSIIVCMTCTDGTRIPNRPGAVWDR